MITTLAVSEWTLKQLGKHHGTAGRCAWVLASNINSFIASGNICCLLKTFANSLDPDCS